MMQKNDALNDAMAEQEMEKVREEFLKSVDVRILDASDTASSFSAIVSSRGPIIIK